MEQSSALQISLRAARVNAGLSANQAAERIGVAVSTLRNWEAGKTYPTKPKIDRICEVYNIDFDVLFFS